MVEAEDAYGYEIVKRLRKAGLGTVGDASVYGTLQRLFEDGLVSSYMIESQTGPKRRYYSITRSGHAERTQARAGWKSFHASVSALLSPEPTSAR